MLLNVPLRLRIISCNNYLSAINLQDVDISESWRIFEIFLVKKVILQRRIWLKTSHAKKNLTQNIPCKKEFDSKHPMQMYVGVLSWSSRLRRILVHSISFQTFFVRAFRIVIDSWKFTMLLLCILWDDWPIIMISGSNEPLQQQLEYTLLKPYRHHWWISKMKNDM